MCHVSESVWHYYLWASGGDCTCPTAATTQTIWTQRPHKQNPEVVVREENVRRCDVFSSRGVITVKLSAKGKTRNSKSLIICRETQKTQWAAVLWKPLDNLTQPVADWKERAWSGQRLAPKNHLLTKHHFTSWVHCPATASTVTRARLKAPLGECA